MSHTECPGAGRGGRWEGQTRHGRAVQRLGLCSLVTGQALPSSETSLGLSLGSVPAENWIRYS